MSEQWIDLSTGHRMGLANTRAALSDQKHPYRSAYMHLQCLKLTVLHPDTAMKYALGKFPPQSWCRNCRNHFPNKDFAWEDGRRVGT